MKRDEAAEKGLTTYNTGKPCKRGHNSDRYVSTGNCIGCIHEKIENRRRIVAQHRGQRRITREYTLTLEQHAQVQALVSLLQGVPDTNIIVDPAPPSQFDTDEKLLALWTGLHGEYVARQMLARRNAS